MCNFIFLGILILSFLNFSKKFEVGPAKTSRLGSLLVLSLPNPPWFRYAVMLFSLILGQTQTQADDFDLPPIPRVADAADEPFPRDPNFRSPTRGDYADDEESAGESTGFSLDDRLKELEKKYESQQTETDQLRKKLSDLGAAKDAKPDPKSIKGSWKNQLNFESADKNFTAHFGGRTQLDAVWMGANPAAYGKSNGTGDSDAVDFRRARLRMEGTIYKTIDYIMEYDFLNTVNDNPGLQPASVSNVINVPAPTDLQWTFREVPGVGNVRVGNQKEPIGLEHITSSRYLDFMERSFNQDAYTGSFNNGFTPGVSIFSNFGEDQRGLWHFGVFKNVVNVFAYGVADNAYAYDGRLTYLLWDEEEGRQLLHVGGALSHRNMAGDAIRIRSRGSLRNGPSALDPVFADTGNFLGDFQEMAAAEMALVLGSFQLQSEYIASMINNSRNLTGTTNYGNYLTNGYYVMASYFLTGEHREYEKKNASFGRVIPGKNSRLCPQDCTEPGYGAWQVLARYSALDLNDNNLSAGQLWDVTLGVNWFLNPNMKIQANYIYMDRNALSSSNAPGAGSIQGFGMRLAHDF